MRCRFLTSIAIFFVLSGCQSFSEVCLDVAGGPGWEETRPPEWGTEKLAELGWSKSSKSHWYYNGSDTYRVCRYRSVKYAPHCGRPETEEFQHISGQWTRTMDSVYICH